MQLTRSTRPVGLRRLAARRLAVRSLAATVVFSLAACSQLGDKTAGPILPPNPPENPMLSRAAFVFRVNTSTHEVNITAPDVTVNPGAAPVSAVSADLIGPDFSLVAGDVITLTASNYSASAVGQFTPNKIRVTFDINITNKLSSVSLITPTFPAPPPGTSGILMFPFATYVSVTSGGVSVGGNGDSVIVDLPNQGQVATSTDWNGDGSPGSGAPYNFFNDAACPVGSNDCYRYETYAAPLLPGATSAARSVGFDIDPTVSRFSAKIVIAADLQNSGAAPTGTIAGSVSSPQRGALSGVLVTANTGGFTGTTNGTGAYSIANVTTGPKTVTVSNLPAGCSDPGPQSTTVSSGATSTVNFSVTCTVPAGTVSGSLTRTGPASPSLAGTIVTATPAAAGTSPAATTLAAGAANYSISGVAIGSGAGAGNGSVALSNLPGGCSSAPGSYTGLTLGGTVTVNFTIDCQNPPAFYQYQAQWGAISGGQVTLTLRYDPSTLNDPAVNGAAADDINAFQADIGYSPTRLQFVSCANVAGSTFQNINANGATAGTITLLNFMNGAGATTQQALGVCTFNVLAGAATSVTTATTFTAVSSFSGANLIPNTQKNEGTLSIP